MKFFRIIAAIFIVAIMFNNFCYAAQSAPLDPAGTTGIWITLDAKAFADNVGIKVFRDADKQKIKRDSNTEFLTWMHINQMYHFILEKYKKLQPEWKDAPFSTFVYSSDPQHTGPYDHKEISPVLEDAQSKLQQKESGIYLNNPYLIMENFTSPYSCKKKVSASGWKEVLDTFIKNNTYIKKEDKANYMTKLVTKIGYTLLCFYFLGVTIDDCDMFIVFKPEYNKDAEDIFKLNAASPDDLIEATRIKLIDFGESRIFYTTYENKIIAIDQSWYTNTPTTDTTKGAIQNKIEDMKTMFKENVDIKTYLGDMADKFKRSFNILTEFPSIKPQIKTKFDELKKVFGPLKYDAQIDEILESPLQSKLSQLKSSLQKLKTKLQAMQDKLGTLRGKLGA